MQEFLKDDLTLFAVPLYVAALLLKMGCARRHGLHWFRRGDPLALLAMGGLAVVVEILPHIAFLYVMVWLHEVSPLRDVV